MASYPRTMAIRVLTRVLSDHQNLDDALAAVSGEVSPEHRGWLQEICSGTLRWKGRLDLAIDSIALKKKPSGWLRKALLIATYQLVAQDRVSASQVVTEMVDEIKRMEGDAPAKFANALLRRVSEQAEQWRALPFEKGTPEREAQWASLPDWIWNQLVIDHGGPWARDFALATLERPRLWIRARDAKPFEGWTRPGPTEGSLEVVRGPGPGKGAEGGPDGALTEWPGFAGGNFFVQDISSQLLVHEISSEVRRALGGGGLHALDLCAAPGGKSVGLAWNGFDVTATDRDAPRTELLRQTVDRVAKSVQVLNRDELPAPGSKAGTFDLVWVDAPCSGSGIIRRHPDVRWLRRESEIAGLNRLQNELFIEAWMRVRPGGFLAYSVCSVFKKEGEKLVTRLAAGLDGAETVKRWDLWPQLAPHGDGFWAALLRKPA